MRGPFGIVFDLDDTLYLERDYARSGIADLAEWLGDRRFAEAAWREFCSGDRSRVFDAALPTIGRSPEPQLVAELVRRYRSHRPVITLAPDAARFLDRWPASLPLALLSDGFGDSQRNKVAALGLESSRLDPLVFTDAWGREFWKPHCRGFEFVAATWSLPASRLVYVADNPAKDFVAPNRLGWRTVQIARPEGVHSGNPAAPGGEPQFVIRSLDELEPAVLDLLVEPASRHCQGDV